MSKLTEILDKYRNSPSSSMKVGIMGDKTYPDGELVAFVGYVNEYGYSGTVPARKQKIYHSINPDGSMKNQGRFVKADKSNFERIVDVPEYELNIPSRPFFRTAISNEKEKLKVMASSLLSENDLDTALRLLGEHMIGALQDSVMTWSEPPNAKSTIKGKGYDAPLRANDKLLRNSFSYEIEND